MIKDILAFIGGTLGLFVRFVLIIMLSVVGVYCLGTSLLVHIIWDGLIRILCCAACAGGVVLLIRLRREKEEPYDPREP